MSQPLCPVKVVPRHRRSALLSRPSSGSAGKQLGKHPPAAGGPTEAFCKTLTVRLKGSGMRWDRPNAEAVMALAALEHSHLWDAYWTLQQRHAA